MAAAAAGPAVVGPTAAEPARGSSSSSAPVRMRSAAPVRESGVSVVVAAAAAAASAEPVVAARAEPARGSSSSVAPVCTRSAVPGSLNPQPVDGARDITSKLKSKVEMALPSASSKSDFMHVSKKIRCSPRLNKGSASPELDKSNTTHSKKKKCAVKPTVHHNGPMGKSKRACKKELKLDNENAARVETRKNEFTMSSSWTIKEIENTIYCEDGDRQPGKPSGGVPIVDVDEVDMKGQDGHTSHELSENEKYSEQTKCNELAVVMKLRKMKVGGLLAMPITLPTEEQFPGASMMDSVAGNTLIDTTDIAHMLETIVVDDSSQESRPAVTMVPKLTEPIPDGECFPDPGTVPPATKHRAKRSKFSHTSVEAMAELAKGKPTQLIKPIETCNLKMVMSKFAKFNIEELDRMYLPIVKDHHWFLIVISMSTKTVQIYDSIRRPSASKKDHSDLWYNVSSNLQLAIDMQRQVEGKDQFGFTIFPETDFLLHSLSSIEDYMKEYRRELCKRLLYHRFNDLHPKPQSRSQSRIRSRVPDCRANWQTARAAAESTEESCTEARDSEDDSSGCGGARADEEPRVEDSSGCGGAHTDEESARDSEEDSLGGARAGEERAIPEEDS
uniref:Ubiquitin-like protease family profile domain-containing protein n=2 Tax=Oryza meridionalis TaxID=40149 RepID=A0A0E0FBM0_9ORYZ